MWYMCDTYNMIDMLSEISFVAYISYHQKKLIVAFSRVGFMWHHVGPWYDMASHDCISSIYGTQPYPTAYPEQHSQTYLHANLARTLHSPTSATWLRSNCDGCMRLPSCLRRSIAWNGCIMWSSLRQRKKMTLMSMVTQLFDTHASRQTWQQFATMDVERTATKGQGIWQQFAAMDDMDVEKWGMKPDDAGKMC